MVKRVISCIVMVIVLGGCAQQNMECMVCGEFNLVNLSKNEVNGMEDTDVSLRRNLTINAESGQDYFTIWSWNPILPDSSWTESLLKEIRISKSNLMINEDGTWIWELNSTETFESISHFGGKQYEIEKIFKESGTWAYVHGNDQFITLNRAVIEQNNQVVVLDKNSEKATGESFPFSERKMVKNDSGGRRFEIIKGDLEEQMTLKSVEDAEKLELRSIDNTSYSLTEGDILMTLTSEKEQPKLAVKIKGL